MTIPKGHVDLHREVLGIPGIVAEPFLMVGFHTMHGVDLPPDFDYPNMQELLAARGINDVTALDYFDPRASLRYDLNVPVPAREHERYQTVYDTGTIEHVFDTRQCIENCMRMVKVGGHYFIQTPVKGWFDHGLHTFAPGVMVEALRINGFEIIFLAYSSHTGVRLDSLNDANHVLIWVVGRKTASLGELQIPQQGGWADEYEREGSAQGP